MKSHLSNQEQFARLQESARKDNNKLAIEALAAADQNAYETKGTICNETEYWKVAIASICEAAAFIEHHETREWFQRNGYVW